MTPKKNILTNTQVFNIVFFAHRMLIIVLVLPKNVHDMESFCRKLHNSGSAIETTNTTMVPPVSFLHKDLENSLDHNTYIYFFQVVCLP